MGLGGGGLFHRSTHSSYPVQPTVSLCTGPTDFEHGDVCGIICIADHYVGMLFILLRLQAVFLGPVFAASLPNPFIPVRTVTLTVSSSIPSQRAQTNQNLLWRVGLLLAWALEKWRADIPITQTWPTSALKTSTAQTVTPHCQQTKQEVQSISKPKPKGVCQRDFIIFPGCVGQWRSFTLRL